MNTNTIVSGVVLALVGTGMLSVEVEKPADIVPVVSAELESEPMELLAIRDLLTEAVGTLQDHTNRLSRIETAVSEGVVISENPPDQLVVPDIPEVVPEMPQPVASEPLLPEGWTLNMWSAEWCTSCVRFKAEELPKFAAGEVLLVDYDARKTDADRLGIKTLPTFEVVGPNGTSRLRIVGFRTSEQLQTSVKKQAGRVAVRCLTSPIRRDRYGTFDLRRPYHCGRGNCRMCNSRAAARRQYQQTRVEAKKPAAVLPPGQHPAPMRVVNHAIQSLELDENDTIADLGCGDGRALVAAVSSAGCRGIGVEINEGRAEVARSRVRRAGLSDRIRIITGDALTFDLAEAGVTAVYVYLFPDLLERLRPSLAGLPVVSIFHEIPGMAGKELYGVWLYS